MIHSLVSEDGTYRYNCRPHSHMQVNLKHAYKRSKYNELKEAISKIVLNWWYILRLWTLNLIYGKEIKLGQPN